jgi:plastocyanin
MKKAAVLILILVSVPLLACGSASDSSSNGNTRASSEAGGKPSTSTVDFEADWTKTFSYTSDAAAAEAGRVTIAFTNPQARKHDIAIEDPNGKTIGQTGPVAEGADSVVVDLKPGVYTYYCTLPGHRQAGMKGTLTVK